MAELACWWPVPALAWELHCGAEGARRAEAKKAGSGPLGSGPSKLVKSPGCFSPGPGEPLKNFFFTFIDQGDITSRLLFQPVGGVGDNAYLFYLFTFTEHLPSKGFVYIIYFNLYNNPACLRFYYPPILQVRKPRPIEVKCLVTGSQQRTGSPLRQSDSGFLTFLLQSGSH